MSKKIRISDDVVSKKLQEEEILLQLKSGTYYGLNETGAVLFERIKSGATEEDLVQTLAFEFDVSLEQASRDVREILVELERNHLVCGER